MEKTFVILLWSFFLPFLVGLSSGASIFASGIGSPDKLLKPVLMYVLFMLLIFNRGWSSHKKVSHYFIPSVLFLLLLAIHYLFERGYIADVDSAKKEIFRMVVFVIIILASSMIRMQIKDYRFLIYVMTAFGLPLSVFAIIQSATGQTDMSWKYVSGYLRAGTGLVDANSLGAVLNITALLALAGYMIIKHKLMKLSFLAAFVLSLGARFSTFSSGSFISIAVSLFIIFFFLRKIDAKLFKQYFSVAMFGLIVLLAVIVFYGLFDALFYRLSLSDESVVKASVTSRWSQYIDLVTIFLERGYVLIIGAGSIGATLEISNGLNFHNSYLRPLVTTGIIGFICFMILFFISFKNYLAAARNPANTKEEKLIYVILYASFVGWSVQAATVPNDTSVIQWYFFILAYSLEGVSSSKRSTLPVRNKEMEDSHLSVRYKKCELLNK